MKKLLTASLIILSSLSYAKIEVLDRIAIIVDDGVVMESQIKNTIEDIIGRYEDQNLEKPPQNIIEDQVSEKLIIEELQLQMADRAGIKISDAELNITMGRLASNNQMTLEGFISFIEENGDSYEDLREEMRREMRIQRIQRGRVNSSVDITEKEFEAFLATDESLETLQPELLVRQILVKDIDQANKIAGQINDGGDFAEIASKFSISSNASTGGLINWRRMIDMPQLFEKALNKKSVGFISEPLESGSGYHILKLEDKRGEFVKYEEQWQSRHILLIPSAIRSEEDTEKQLNEIRERVLLGEDFISLADEFSEDPGSAKLGGDLGWLGLGVLEVNLKKQCLKQILEFFLKCFKLNLVSIFSKSLEKERMN